MKPDKALGKKVRELRKQKGWTLKDLEAQSTIKYPLISILENDGVGSVNTIERVCKTLGIERSESEDSNDSILRVGFTLSHWPAPIIWINEQLGQGDFFRKVAFSCYSDEDEQPVFNEYGKKLAAFDPETHSFFFSGEIKRMVIEEKLDIGFLGSDVLHDEPDIIKVARIMCATEIRHHIAVILPDDLILDKSELIEILLNDSDETLPSCLLLYHPNSTAQNEFGKLFFNTINNHDTLGVRPLNSFRKNLKSRILEQKYVIHAYIGVLITAEVTQEIVQEINQNATEGQPRLRSVILTSTEIADYARQKDPELHPMRLPPLYYDIITQRNNKRIKELAKSEGFALFFTKLWEAIRVLNLSENKNRHNSLPNIKVADFFKMNKKTTSEAMLQTEFELVFYPDWVQKAFLLKF